MTIREARNHYASFEPTKDEVALEPAQSTEQEISRQTIPAAGSCALRAQQEYFEGGLGI